jgi:hypothetical protein
MSVVSKDRILPSSRDENVSYLVFWKTQMASFEYQDQVECLLETSIFRLFDIRTIRRLLFLV